MPALGRPRRSASDSMRPTGDAFPAFIGAPPGSLAPVREHDARGHGGGFAPLGALLRRVAGVSRLYWCNSPRLAAPSTWAELDRAPLTAQFPRLVAVRSRFGVVERPHRRPPRRQTPTTGYRGRGGLRLGGNDAWPRVSLAREPAIARANRLYRTRTRYSVSGRGCPRSHERVNVRMSGPTLALAGPGADQRAHVRAGGLTPGRRGRARS